ncbi:MAG: DUF3187 family protein [Thermoanaerobaculia bacterium]|nr:DUF3187 family protein [Thermoanaerobaculia bacterium]
MTCGRIRSVRRSFGRGAIALLLAVSLSPSASRAAESPAAPSPPDRTTAGPPATDPVAADPVPVDPETTDPVPVEQWGGLPKVREQFPLTTGFLILEPTSAFVLPAGTWRASAAITWSNTFTAQQDVERALAARAERSSFEREAFERFAAADTDDQTFYLDAQVTRLVFELSRGIGHGLELSLAVPAVEMHGGFTDFLVEPFHDALGFDQEGRSGVHHDGFGLFVSGQGLELAIESDVGPKVGDVEVGIKKRLAGRSAAWSLLVEAEAKLPTGDDERLISSGSVDVGLGLAASRCWRSRCIHGMVGTVWAGASDRLGTDRRSILNAAVGLEERFSERWRLTVQGSYWQSYLAGIGFEHFAEDTVQLAVAVSRRIGPPVGGAGEVLVGLSENAFSFKNSADVSFHLGWQRRFE